MYKAIGFNLDMFHIDNKFTLNDLREHIRTFSLSICKNYTFTSAIAPYKPSRNECSVPHTLCHTRNT